MTLLPCDVIQWRGFRHRCDRCGNEFRAPSARPCLCPGCTMADELTARLAITSLEQTAASPAKETK